MLYIWVEILAAILGSMAGWIRQKDLCFSSIRPLVWEKEKEDVGNQTSLHMVGDLEKENILKLSRPDFLDHDGTYYNP